MSKVTEKQKFVLVQKPNVPIMIWMVAKVFEIGLPEGTLKDLAGVVAFGAIFTWSWLEITDGVNWFRKSLGAVVLAFVITSRL